MHLRAVATASGSELAACAVAAARNAHGLLHDAELLADAGRQARAYALAALAVEECGKAVGLTTLAVLPEDLRMRAPVGRMLEWHQLKQLGGLLIALVPPGSPGPASRLAAMSAAELAQTLSAIDAPATEADRLKRRGLYVDMDRRGRIRGPSEITEAEAAEQLARARRAADAASALCGPDVQARLADPPPEEVELAMAVVNALTESGQARTPAAAARIMLNVVSVPGQRRSAEDPKNVKPDIVIRPR